MATNLMRGWIYITMGVGILLAFLWWVEYDKQTEPAPEPEPQNLTPAIEEGTPVIDLTSKPPTRVIGNPSDQIPPEPYQAPKDTPEEVIEESEEPENRQTDQQPVIAEPAKTDLPEDPGPQGFCSPINGKTFKDVIATGRPDGRQGLEIRFDNDAAVRAVVSGTVVRVFESPYTGTSLYLVDRNASYSFMYGRFDALAPGIETGSFVACGDVLGYMPLQGGSLNMAVRKIRWWDSDPVDMNVIFEEQK